MLLLIAMSLLLLRIDGGYVEFLVPKAGSMKCLQQKQKTDDGDLKTLVKNLHLNQIFYVMD